MLPKNGRQEACFVHGLAPIEEFETANGPADYALCVDGRILGVVEAKKLTLSPMGVLTQAERLAPDRLNVALYGGLAGLALLLAALGSYGVTSYTVAQRTAEIGLRMALGAGRTKVRLQILREGQTLAGGGLLQDSEQR